MGYDDLCFPGSRDSVATRNRASAQGEIHELDHSRQALHRHFGTSVSSRSGQVSSERASTERLLPCSLIEYVQRTNFKKYVPRRRAPV